MAPPPSPAETVEVGVAMAIIRTREDDIMPSAPSCVSTASATPRGLSGAGGTPDETGGEAMAQPLGECWAMGQDVMLLLFCEAKIISKEPALLCTSLFNILLFTTLFMILLFTLLFEIAIAVSIPECS